MSTESDTPVTPSLGHLVARHEEFNEIVEIRPSQDGDLIIVATPDGNYATLASGLTPAGAVKGVRIWK